MASLNLISIIGLATFFNFAIILSKLKHANYANAAADSLVFASISYMFRNSTSALAIGMIASMLFSLYLIKYPLHFNINNTTATPFTGLSGTSTKRRI